MPTRSDIQIFTYTAKRGPFMTVFATLGSMMFMENCIVLFLILLLIPNIFLKLFLTATIVLLQLYVILGLMLSALRTKHTLSEQELHLHYGKNLNIRLPQTALKSIQPIYERLTLVQPISASYDGRRQHITACFSEEGQILLTLHEPRKIRYGNTQKLVRTLLINVDQRQELLRALTSKSVTLSAHQAAEVHLREGPQQIAKEQNAVLDTQGIAIRINGLSKRFKKFIAVQNLHMLIKRGEIYGFLGSNGAGKTTTIKMLVGLLVPSEGQAWLGGYNVWEEPEKAKRILGYVSDHSLLYERLTGREYLEFIAQMRGLEQREANERITQILELLDLQEQASRLCGSYSFGMKRKLSLAGTLLHQPPILILDEPLNGLDPRSARRLKDLFLELAAAGTTILLSTHDLATAEQVCHRVGIFHKGQLLIEGSASELRTLATASNLEEVFLNLTAEQKEEIAV